MCIWYVQHVGGRSFISVICDHVVNYQLGLKRIRLHRLKLSAHVQYVYIYTTLFHQTFGSTKYNKLNKISKHQNKKAIRT